MTPAQVAHIMALVDDYRRVSISLRYTRAEEAEIRAAVEAALRDAPTQASQLLTDEQIDQMWREATIKPALTSEFVRTFARAVEAAHGIGAAQKGKP